MLWRLETSLLWCAHILHLTPLFFSALTIYPGKRVPGFHQSLKNCILGSSFALFWTIFRLHTLVAKLELSLKNWIASTLTLPVISLYVLIRSPCSLLSCKDIFNFLTTLHTSSSSFHSPSWWLSSEHFLYFWCLSQNMGPKPSLNTLGAI